MKTIPVLNSIKDIPKIENLGVNIEFDPQNEDINPYDQLEDKDAKYVCEQYDIPNN